MLLRKSGIWGSLAVAGLLVSGAAGASIVGSAHDFTIAGTNQDAIGNAGMCDACHIPHTTAQNADAPLWVRIASDSTFTPYVSSTGTMDATFSWSGAALPDGMSKICLSCHDGATALDSYGAVAGTTPMTGAAVVGTALTNDHPVAFAYQDSIDGGDGGLLSAAAADAYLFGGQVECASCHDVHNDLELGSLLRESTASLCVGCHSK